MCLKVSEVCDGACRPDLAHIEAIIVLGHPSALLRQASEDVPRVVAKVGNVRNDGPELLKPHFDPASLSFFWGLRKLASDPDASPSVFRAQQPGATALLFTSD